MAQKLNPGRLAAGHVLVAVHSGMHADLEMERQPDLSHSDRGLAWHLVQGVLRNRGELDAALNRLSKRPMDQLDVPVQAALRIGAFELRHSRTPPHAAVDQAVRLAIALQAGRAKGLVNALLRRVAKVDLPENPTRNHPDWLVKRWSERFSVEDVSQWCARNDQQAPLVIACRGDVDDLRTRLTEEVERVEAVEIDGKVLPNALRLVGVRGTIKSLSGFNEGEWWVMDAAAIATADLLDVKAGERVLDACAAPGGKSFRMASRGAVVTAVDRSRNRLRRLQENIDRLDFEVDGREWDWIERSSKDFGEFDAVLVDAPCTGLGTIRRHPEIRWRTLPSDPMAMSLTQKPILEAAAACVRSGGRLVYAVCSPEPEEGSMVVEAFLKAHPDFQMDACLDLVPPGGDEDAFYAARLIREGK